MWLPDAILVNVDLPYEMFRMENEPVRIYSNGESDFFPGGIINARCRFDLSFFPFDIQNCSFQVESWRLLAEEQIFTEFEGKGMRLVNLSTNEQWQVISSGYQIADIVYRTGAYASVNFYLILQRKAGYYFINVIIPSTLISAAETATFLLPVYSETRLELSFTCLLSYSVFQIFIASEMPRSAVNPPMLSTYIAIMSSFIFLACVSQSIILLLADKSTNGATFPTFFSDNLLERMALGESLKDFKWDKARNSALWAYLTTTANRITSFFYMFVIIVAPLICFVVIPRIISPSSNISQDGRAV